MNLSHAVATVTGDIVAFGTYVAFIILLVAMLTELPVMWRKEIFGSLVCSRQYTFSIYVSVRKQSKRRLQVAGTPASCSRGPGPNLNLGTDYLPGGFSWFSSTPPPQ